MSLIGNGAKRLDLGAEERRRAGYLRGAEHRAESQERVEQNLDPWEIPMWRKHRYAKDAHGRLLFTGTPDHKAMRFREWLEEHQREVQGQRARAGEAKAVEVVRSYEARPAIAVPCREPYRFRTKAACNPETPRKRRPKWMGSSLLRSGRSVEVPCAEPNRYRVKELCDPNAKWRRVTTPLEVEEPHAFEGLL
jgi:hypothetical protein